MPPFTDVSAKQISLAVVSARGLAKADIFGESDPYAVVLLNSQEVGRTRTMFKTLEPSWTDPEEAFTLRLARNSSSCDVVVEIWDEHLGERST